MNISQIFNAQLSKIDPRGLEKIIFIDKHEAIDLAKDFKISDWEVSSPRDVFASDLSIYLYHLYDKLYPNDLNLERKDLKIIAWTQNWVISFTHDWEPGDAPWSVWNYLPRNPPNQVNGDNYI